jgi:AraC family transcriptional regulator
MNEPRHARTMVAPRDTYDDGPQSVLLTPCQWGAVLSVRARSNRRAANQPVPPTPTRQADSPRAAFGENDDAISRALSDLLRIVPDVYRDIDDALTNHLHLALNAYRAITHRAPAVIKGALAGWQQRKAIDMLSSDLVNPVPLPEVAATLGISLTHFSRCFKLSTGRSPHQWINDRRLERCRSLLIDSDASLNQIALACGFREQTSLTHAFSKSVGMGPAEWRRNFRHIRTDRERTTAACLRS